MRVAWPVFTSILLGLCEHRIQRTVCTRPDQELTRFCEWAAEGQEPTQRQQNTLEIDLRMTVRTMPIKKPAGAEETTTAKSAMMANAFILSGISARYKTISEGIWKSAQAK